MTEHSKKFDKVKKYYDRGLWNKSMVANAVVKEWTLQRNMPKSSENRMRHE